MNSEAEETIFEAALALPPEQRGAYLDKECGADALLRRRVGALLKAHENAGAFMAEPAAPAPVPTVSAAVPLTEKPGDKIGHYKLLQEIGEGGCGVTVNYIAKWDSSAWSALGSGLDGGVQALAVSGGNLYAGGAFTTAGGVPANSIAKWDGSAWSALGSGISGTYPWVYALAVGGTNLYAGGAFTNAGGVAANRIARWDGSAWSALGSGMNNNVLALAVSGTALYAGGSFTSAGGMPANHIAKWDGSAWSALGSGTDKSISALAADGAGHLFVGGSFNLAGTTVSPYIAQANIIPPRGEIERIAAGSGWVTLDCLGCPGSVYAMQRATDVRFTQNLTTLLTTNPPSPDGWFRYPDPTPPNPSGFYRLWRE